MIKSVGSITGRVFEVAIHPLSSITVQVYCPAASPVIVLVCAPLFQKKLIFPVPPVGTTDASPSVRPKHDISMALAVACSSIGSNTSILFSVTLHPLTSVTVQLYIPAASPVAVCVVCPLFQENE